MVDNTCLVFRSAAPPLLVVDSCSDGQGVALVCRWVGRRGNGGDALVAEDACLSFFSALASLLFPPRPRFVSPQRVPLFVAVGFTPLLNKLSHGRATKRTPSPRLRVRVRVKA